MFTELGCLGTISLKLPQATDKVVAADNQQVITVTEFVTTLQSYNKNKVSLKRLDMPSFGNKQHDPVRTACCCNGYSTAAAR